MTLTVRLKREPKARFSAVCQRRRVTKSKVVERLIREYVARKAEGSSYEVAEKLGIVGIGCGSRRALGRDAEVLARGVARSAGL